MHVIGQHDPRIDVERVARSCGADGAAERVDLGNEQVGMSIAQIDREEV
jgi:hypothetical protein